MTFHVPKGLQLIATGTKVSESTEDKITTTEWKTDVPLPVVGFNLGDFVMKEATLPGKARRQPHDRRLRQQKSSRHAFQARSQVISP